MSRTKKPAKTGKKVKKPVKKAAAKTAKPKPKIAAKPAAKKEAVPKKEAAVAKKPVETKPPAVKAPKARKKPAAAAKPITARGEAKPGLGYKWGCFSCNAKFYDLGRPDPICPRCGADQRTRPASDAPPAPLPQRRPAQPPMARYLDDEEAPAEEAFVDEGEEEAAEIDIEAIEDTGAFVEPDYEDE
jgi:hypothetical protein